MNFRQIYRRNDSGTFPLTGLCVAQLRQKQGSVYMIPVSNMLTLPDGQTNCFTLPTHHYSGISTVKYVGGHPEIMVKCTRPNIHATPTNHDHDHMGEAADRTFLGSMSAIDKGCLHQLFIRLSKKPKRTKNTSWSGTNFDANQGEFIQTAALSINFSKQNVQIVNKKTFIEAILCVQYQQTAFYQCTHLQ